MKVARPVRVELTTYSFGGCRSIHLSYGRAVAFHSKALESHSRENCDVFDYSNACTACAPERSRGTAGTAFLARAGSLSAGGKLSSSAFCPGFDVVSEFFNFFSFFHQRQRQDL